MIHKIALIVAALIVGRSHCHTLIPMSADAKLEDFPGEKPLAADVLEWTRVNKLRLTPDQRALVDGYVPRSLLAYAANTVPAVLVADATPTRSTVPAPGS